MDSSLPSSSAPQIMSLTSEMSLVQTCRSGFNSGNSSLSMGMKARQTQWLTSRGSSIHLKNQHTSPHSFMGLCKLLVVRTTLRSANEPSFTKCILASSSVQAVFPSITVICLKASGCLLIDFTSVRTLNSNFLE
ncbi:hypothetical protein M758_UG123700 [Ceratodon purpureus]|nr:hypothetical protein M758_UG123700 [Ceratodon purpureus]